MSGNRRRLGPRPAVSEGVIKALEIQRSTPVTSPLYRHLLGVMLNDVAAGGPCAEVLSRVNPSYSPVADAVALRFLAGVHRAVLDGAAPRLARFYPSAGGTVPEGVGDAGPHLGLDAAFVETVARHRLELAAALDRQVQTNEVGRSAALVVGFLAAARWSRLPLRILEIGASAGLNLRWDRYRYEGGRDGSTFGPASSPLCFEGYYEEPKPALSGPAEVADRRGCDRYPVDATTAAGRLTLRSFVWPDQPERLAALDAALAVAASPGSPPAPVDAEDALVWLARHLDAPGAGDGACTVVVHSIVWQYLPRATREGIRILFDRVGGRANRRRPLVWLRLEPGADPALGAELRLRHWPAGDDRLLAIAGYHGRPVRLAD